MSEPDQGFGLYIKRISDLLGKYANRNLQSHNLTVSQVHMLMHMAGEKRPSYSLKELETRFRVAQSTMAGLASRLERKGLVESLSDPDDKRVKRLRLTEAGHAVCQAAICHIHETEDRLTACLTPQERSQLLSLLRRVYEANKEPSQKG
ncbi:MAG: MarR family transcriptional regulator [Clostridiales bacterium]|nr:MarR family transcriptional regulator [Clostridiales bacterium]